MAFKEVSPAIASDELERGILDFWEREQIFAKTLAQRKGSELFAFYDGPPYATGKPHYGHVLQSAIKDTVLRYKTMQGYYVPRRVGWDCHGLPVEVLVEKELGFKSKKDIEAMGIAAFNQKCREVVFRYIDDFTNLLKRMGRWADYEGAYATLNRDYMEKEWGVFKQLWDKGLVYKAFRSTAYCVRCGTPLSNHEVTMGYKEKEDETVYVLLPVSQQLALLVWTTTPWTLPGNAAVAFNPELTYVSVAYNDREVIVAEARVKAIFGDEAKITKRWSTGELEQLTYAALYGVGQKTVVPARHVTAEDGTGLVHTAPAFGEEDFIVGQAHNLPMLRTVDLTGKFTAEVPQFAGQHIFKAGALVTADLAKRGLLFKQEKYRHNYPFCWRCDTPLIYYALDTWFVKVTAIKERMIELNEQINWTPEHVKHGRFGKGLESAPDWAVSRSRFWGVPLPVWECDGCERRVAVGSVAELQELFKGASKGVRHPKVKVSDTLQDLHRPFVDEITWACKGVRHPKVKVSDPLCTGTMKRVPEVLDVWFDAGSMPYASGVAGFPADFIVESIEMTRAWFYFLHVLATATKDSVAFKNVVASGIIFGEDGQKLSKKLKNYPEPEPILKTYGADVLRFYLLASSSLGEPYRFSEQALKELKQNVYRPLWNVFSFFTRYAGVHNWVPAPHPIPLLSKERGILDRWVLARFKQLQKEVITAADGYQVDVAARAFQPFIDDLSNWYVRRSRARFQTNAKPEERAAAFSTLYYILVELSKLLAPFMPFVSEEIYRILTKDSSVHLALLPKAGQLVTLEPPEEELLTAMAVARAIVSEALKARAAAGIKVRQPLGTLSITTTADLTHELQAMIADEVNVKTVLLRSDDTLEIQLDTALTPELTHEGWMRDVIRQGQVLRKQAGYDLNQRIGLILQTTDADLARVLEDKKKIIATALQAYSIVEQHVAPEAATQLTLGAGELTIGVFAV